MLAYFVQRAARNRKGFTAALQHAGAAGLFGLAILDSSPIPTFGGPDILIAILAARHRNPWYEYAMVATLGSILGAYLTYRLAHRAGKAYLQNRFGKRRFASPLKFFEKWGTGALVVSTAIPFPFPTSALFAAAGASGYSRNKYLLVVFFSRAARYAGIALIAASYGRHFIRMLRHPLQYWPWVMLVIFVVVVVALGVHWLERQTQPEIPSQP
ncbi:MAG TPA: VTT domain-containing protein [Terriglobales bacterium]|nr:VTT domain-containing protein [Terriglobales bacterium]